jgi:hypothetical protein
MDPDLLRHPLVVGITLSIGTALITWFVRHRRAARAARDSARNDLALVKAALLGEPGHEEYGELPRVGLVQRVANLEREFIADGNGSMRTLAETIADGVANLEESEENFREVWAHNVSQAEGHGIEGLRRPDPFTPVVRNRIHRRPKPKGDQ